MNRISLLLLLVIALCACKSSPHHEITDITDIVVDVNKVDESIDFSPFVENQVEAVKLETNDSCLIADISQIAYSNGVIYIADKVSQSIYAFNKSGKFIKKIGAVGNGPGEYTHMGRFQVDKDHIYIMDDSTRKLYDYNLLTSSCVDILLDDELNFRDFCVMENNLFLFSNNGFSLKGAYNLYQVDMTDNSLTCRMPFKKEILDQHSTWGIPKCFGRFGNEILAVVANNDTIYEITKEKAVPRYAVRFSERMLPDDIRQKDGTTILTTAMDKNYIRGIETIDNLGDYFLAMYPDNIIRSILYNRKTNEMKVANWLTLDDWGGLYLTYYAFSDNGDLIIADTAHSFMSSWNDLYSTKSFANAKDKTTFKGIYEKTGEEDNPIVFIYKMKKEL